MKLSKVETKLVKYPLALGGFKGEKVIAYIQKTGLEL